MSFEPTKPFQLIFSGVTRVSLVQIVLLGVYEVTAEQEEEVCLSWYQCINLQSDQISFNIKTASFCLKDL